MKEKFEEKIDKFNNYFGLPILILLILSVIRVKLQNSEVKTVLDWIMTILFIVYLVFVVSLMCRKLIKQKFMISILITSCVLLAIAYFLTFSNNIQFSNIFFLLGIISLEIYFLCVIIFNIYNKSKKLWNIIIMSFTFIALGVYSIYICCYNETNNDLFNALVSIFAAIIGGSVTLVGVAWTINNNKEEKEQENIEKAMPYFTFNLVIDKPKIIDKMKVCFSEELNYDCYVYGEIENSNHSVVILKRIYHDENWFSLQCNNTLIQSGKLMLSFKFSNPDNIILEVSDILGNLYYYKLNVIHTAVFSRTKFGLHTIRNIERIDNPNIK